MAQNTLEFDIFNLLRRIYPKADLDALTQRVIAAFFDKGHPQINAKEKDKKDTRLWSEQDSILITYGNTLQDGTHKPLDILYEFLTHHLKGVINSVHILPFFSYTSDDGFAITDFRKVDSALGDWTDIERIGKQFHLMSDMVLNHVSSQSKWFNDFRQAKPPFDQFFFTAPKDADVSAVVRPRATPLLQPIDTSKGTQYVWCTFSHDQVDLNYANPDVLLEILKIVRLHIDKGVRLIRLDAVAFLWKEIGTSCIHMPQTHAVIQLLRILIDYCDEQVILITETNVPKAENLSYFGQSNEAHMIYNFPLPPLILHAMLSGSSRYLRAWQASMPPAPPKCAYLNFSASHDGIGMRPVEGLLPGKEIVRMIDTIQKDGGLVSMRTAPNGTQSVYELNCSFFAAMARTFEDETSLQFERFLTSQTIVMSLEGIPAFYIHSMLATPNDHKAVETRGMNRAINRHRWQYDMLEKLLADPTSNQSRAMKMLSDRLKIRTQQPAFHPNATQFTLALNERIFGLWRQSPDRQQSIFALHNVSAETVKVPIDALNLIADEDWYDLLDGTQIEAGQTHISLMPYQCRWLTNFAS